MVKSCIFCSSLYRDLLGLSDTARRLLLDGDSPFYQWNIHSTAKSRESKNSIVVTFSLMSHQRRSGIDRIGPSQRSTGDVSQADNPPSQSPLTSQKVQGPLRFHLVSDDDLSHVPTKDDLGFSTDPTNKGVGLQITKWIDDCNRNHPKCIKAAKTAWVPTRLLDLQFGDGSSIRLVKTREEGITGPYVTLSHCWGPPKEGNLFLTLQGELEHKYKMHGIKILDLKSTNFVQAISLARHLGIRYIWIDSLCIIQGALSDFHTEGQLMHKVYRNSYCNFAAADSVDSRGGLFRKRDPKDVLPGMYKGDGSSAIFGATTWRILPDDLWEAQLLDTSIYTRGWVFQGKASYHTYMYDGH